MGYTTDFEGSFELSRPLTVREYNLLIELAETRHGDNTKVESGYPGFWCQWRPDSEGESLEWDGGEKFYDYVEWLNLIIDRFLRPWGVGISGKVHYQGEEVGDHGNIVIRDGRAVQVPDADVGDMAERLETYVEELSSNRLTDPTLQTAKVIDRLSAILYGDPS